MKPTIGAFVDGGAAAIDIQPLLGRREISVIPTIIDAAYAAGFFDGEGHITIAFMSTKVRAKGAVYTMRVGAAQNDTAPLLWLRDRWGGSVGIAQRKTSAGNCTYRWTLCSRKAAAFLRDVLPHLIVKRQRAEIALRFQETLFIPGSKGHTAEYRASLEAFRIKITSLNTHKPIRSIERATHCLDEPC